MDGANRVLVEKPELMVYIFPCRNLVEPDGSPLKLNAEVIAYITARTASERLFRDVAECTEAPKRLLSLNTFFSFLNKVV